ncbi:MAG: methyltransferase domain-containing protein [Pseudomonadales bacterium]
MGSPPELPAAFFARQDESDDAEFYREPRFVTHIDDVTIAALTQYYREHLAPEHRVLDLMSSWISHLPEEVRYRSVTGHGMNAEELAANPRLDDYQVQNLNQNPTLPFSDGAFDAVLIAVSVQYLTRPFEVFAEIGRVLAPDGQCIVAMSHRLFPTKAVYAFHVLSGEERCRVVAAYLDAAGVFETIRSVDRSPPQGDPLWIVHGISA